MEQQPQSIMIAFEGIDGSGKSVQFKRLKACLEAAGVDVGVMDFPCYDSFFGEEIGKMLSGRFDRTAANVDVYSMCLWYAMDRWAAFQQHQPGKRQVVLLNRSTMANAAYQATRCSEEAAQQLIPWIYKLEYEILKIPMPDLFFIFDVPVATSRANVAKKGHRDYIGEDADVYERDNRFLEQVRRRYLSCADYFPNVRLLACADENGVMYSEKAIGDQVLAEIRMKFPHILPEACT